MSKSKRFSEGGSGHLRLEWHDHTKELLRLTNDLCFQNEMTDVTLTCAGGFTFTAHKFILAGASAHFRAMFQNLSPWQHPVIFLKDVEASEMGYFLEFMYNGEVNVPIREMEHLIKVARQLGIKGLAGINNDDDDFDDSYDIPPLPSSQATDFVLKGRSAFSKTLLKPSERGTKRKGKEEIPSTTEFLKSIKREKHDTSESKTKRRSSSSSNHEDEQTDISNQHQQHSEFQQHQPHENQNDTLQQQILTSDTLTQQLQDPSSLQLPENQDVYQMQPGTSAMEQNPLQQSMPSQQAQQSIDPKPQEPAQEEEKIYYDEGDDICEALVARLGSKFPTVTMNGYLYHVSNDKCSSSKVYMRCTKKSCKATMQTDKEYMMGRVTTPHNHPPNYGKAEAERFYSNLLKKAVNSDAPIKDVIESCLEDFPQDLMHHLCSRKSLFRRVKEARNYFSELK